LQGAKGAGQTAYGIFCPDMICCIVFSIPANLTGVGPALGLDSWKGNYECTRIIAHPQAPTNTVSRSLPLALNALHKQSQYDWVYSYADIGQNHHGGIYQAVNAVYVGKSKGGKSEFIVDGQRLHGRMCNTLYGTSSPKRIVPMLERAGHTVQVVYSTDKHLYIIPCGTPSTNRKIRKTLAPHTRPYPKRETQ
jgi:hypothetical protein